MNKRYELQKSVKQEFTTRFSSEWAASSEDEVQEYLLELINCNLPVYTVDILEIAISNMWLAVCEPESETTSCTAIGLILSNMSDQLFEDIWSWYL